MAKVKNVVGTTKAPRQKRYKVTSQGAGKHSRPSKKKANWKTGKKLPIGQG